MLAVYLLLITVVSAQSGNYLNDDISGDDPIDDPITTVVPTTVVPTTAKSTTVPILNNNNATVINIISIIPDNITTYPTTMITLFPTTNTSQPCLTMWQRLQILLNFAAFDANQYLDCLTNAGKFTQQNNLIIIGMSIIAILMNN